MELQLHTGDIGNYLKKHDIKPSYQRMKIFQYLLDNHNHPTVDTIYKALCTEIPTLSKTTVYNTLNLFIQFYNMKNNEKFAFAHIIGDYIQYTYSVSTADFIINEIKKDPKSIYENLKKGIEIKKIR